MAQEESAVDSLLGGLDNRGTPQNEHLKKLGKARAARAKEIVEQKKFYSLFDDKILFCTVKATGLYKSYIGKADAMKDFIAKCRAEKSWVEPHLVDEFVKKGIADCQANRKGR